MGWGRGVRLATRSFIYVSVASEKGGAGGAAEAETTTT